MSNLRARPRRRNTVLRALEVFRRLDAPRPTQVMILFLYVCENEGLSVSELAHVSGLSIATAARTLNILACDAPGDWNDADGPLFEFTTPDSDRRLKFVHLSPRGRRLRDEIEDLITEASPIGSRSDRRGRESAAA